MALGLAILLAVVLLLGSASSSLQRLSPGVIIRPNRSKVIDPAYVSSEEQREARFLRKKALADAALANVKSRTPEEAARRKERVALRVKAQMEQLDAKAATKKARAEAKLENIRRLADVSKFALEFENPDGEDEDMELTYDNGRLLYKGGEQDTWYGTGYLAEEHAY